MIRLLFFFLLLAVLAYAGMWLVQHPGHVSLDWFGYQIQTSAALLILSVAVAAVALWILFRVIVDLPSFLRFAARQRSREKGYAALSRGLVAVGSGDARTAVRASAQANRHLKDDSLAMMLEAQAAYLSGNAAGAVRVFGALAQREDTRVFGLRGLHGEASRRGDDEAARQFAAAAHRVTPLPWSAQAVLESHANTTDWEQALSTVEASVAAKLVERDTGERQRAVLETAIARDKEGLTPDKALSLARSAIKRAPDLAPPVVIAARLLSRRGDIRKATKLIEKAWQECQHPDVAQAYLDVRPGDSTTDRLARARTLMGIRSSDPVSRMVVARAALANTDYAAARAALEPLVGEGQRPSVRMCQLMAEIEEAEHGDIGQQREWLARASRATLDPVWVADGIVHDRWEPASPTTGKLDAFRWQVPAERLGPVMDALPPRKPSAMTLPAMTPSTLTPSTLTPPALTPAREAALAPPPALLGHDARPVPGEPDVGATAAAELAVTAAPTASPPQPVAAQASDAIPPSVVPAEAVAPKLDVAGEPTAAPARNDASWISGSGKAATEPPHDVAVASADRPAQASPAASEERRYARTYSSG